MKKLLLTSSGSFITRFDMEGLEKPVREMRMAYITTASNKVDDVSYIEAHKKEMDKQDFDYEEMDIAGKSEGELRSLLADKECVYVEGGNTFYLLKCVRESGFEKVMKELIAQGVLYIGSSAGSYIACPTIEIADKASMHDFDKCGVVDYTAMNLVPFLIKAHYDVSQKEVLREKLKDVTYPIKFLTDDQALLAVDNKVGLIGDGEEIIIEN